MRRDVPAEEGLGGNFRTYDALEATAAERLPGEVPAALAAPVSKFGIPDASAAAFPSRSY
jgi:hypothetical protein